MLNTMCAVALTATLGQGFYGGGGGLSDQMLPYDTQDPHHHGYYQRMPSYGGFNSFRPYNYKHALSQAQAAGGWGLPPVMPYSQQFWDRYQFRASGVQPNLPNLSNPNFQNFGPNQYGNPAYGNPTYGNGYQSPPPVPNQYPGNGYSNYPVNPQYSAQPPNSPYPQYSQYPNQAIPAGGSYYPPPQPVINPATYQLLQQLEEQRLQLEQQIETLRQMQMQQPQQYPYPNARPYPTPSRGLYGP